MRDQFDKYRRSIDQMTDSQVLRDLHRRVVGDGTEQNPGLTMEVDRLKRFSKRLTWAMVLVGGALLTNLAQKAMGWWQGH